MKLSLAGLAAFAQDNDTVMLAGDPFYFKKGVWFRGEKEFDPSGHHFLVNHLEAYTGWTRWSEKKPVDQRLVRCTDYRMKEPREALGFTDKNSWETNERGIAQDPWQPSDRIVLRTMDSGEDLLTFITGSVGGRNAIAKLLGKVAKSPNAAAGKDAGVRASMRHLRFTTITGRSIIRSSTSLIGPIWDGSDEAPQQVASVSVIDPLDGLISLLMDARAITKALGGKLGGALWPRPLPRSWRQDTIAEGARLMRARAMASTCIVLPVAIGKT